MWIKLDEPNKPRIMLLANLTDEKKNFIHWGNKQNDKGIEILELVEAVHEVVATGQITKRCLTALHNGMHSRFKDIYGAAGDRLIQLSHYFPEALELLHQLTQSSKASVRLHAIQSIWRYCPPMNDAEKILCRALTDSSSQVRIFAAMRIDLLNLDNLVPDLENATENEKNSKIKSSMTHSLSMLRNGYALHPHEDKTSFTLWVKTVGGTTSSGPSLSKAECTTENIEQIASKIRAEAIRMKSLGKTRSKLRKEAEAEK